MPNTYIRKASARPRGCWTSSQLQSAVEAITSGSMGVNEAARSFGIPKSTLKRRMKTNNMKKYDRLGPDSMLGANAEEKLARHIKKLQRCGFSPTRQEVREMAYKMAVQLGITTRFNENEGKAGKKWLASFLRRRPDIAVRKAENVSVARATGMSKEIVDKYFEELDKALTNNSLYDKPGNIFNCDETGLQLNTRADKVLAQKGSKCVPSLSPGEKGETISVLACCNAEGGYLPPYSIFKGKNRKEEWSEGMPPGSRIRMSQKSAYVNLEIFLDWLKTHFFPKKPPGTVLLILDGHSSHTSNLETLQFAEEHAIILFCLPPHTTHFLQPLDRSFFKSLKSHYYNACRYFVKNQANRKLTRLNFGKLLGDAWGKSANVQNAVSGFRSTGIMPFNPRAIPDHAFLMGDSNQAAAPADNEQQLEERADSPEPGPSGVQVVRNRPPEKCCSMPDDILSKKATHEERGDLPEPGPSGIEAVQNRTPQKSYSTVSEITPGKALDMVSPVPVITPSVKKVRRQISGVLSTDNITDRKRKIMKKNKSAKKYKKQSKSTKTSSSSESDVVLDDSEDEDRLSDYENECVGCGEDYRMTKKKDDWIRCVLCKRWLHEGCTSYESLCQTCGTSVIKKKK